MVQSIELLVRRCNFGEITIRLWQIIALGEKGDGVRLEASERADDPHFGAASSIYNLKIIENLFRASSSIYNQFVKIEEKDANSQLVH